MRREFYHPVRTNFFAPWIACLFLVLGAPRLVAEMHHGVWYAVMAPIFCLELKIYGGRCWAPTSTCHWYVVLRFVVTHPPRS